MLIGAVWLLLLCTALVAIIMLRAANEGKAAAAAGDMLRQRLDLDAAVQTVAAEMLVEGPRSQWSRMPAQGNVQIEGRSVSVSITSEAGRLDLNDIDVKIFDSALQGLGCSRSARTAFLSALGERRARGRIGSTADLDELVGDPATLNRCATADVFTIDSGLLQPDPSQANPIVQRALGIVQPPESGPTSAGQGLRVTAKAMGGMSISQVIRLNVVGKVPMSVSRSWQ